MKLPNWFKILWWILLFILLSYAVSIRFSSFEAGKSNAVDTLVLIIWFALALVPIFNEIELPGLKLKQDRDPLEKQKDENVSILNPSKVKEILEAFDSPLLIDQERMLREEMKKIKPTTEDEKDQILYRALASSQIAATFEKTYSVIFGSQLKALQYLNESGGLVDVNNLLQFYRDAKASYLKFYATYSFESWVKYMQSAVLVIKEGEKVGITIRGKELLKYIVDKRYSLNKAG